MRTSPFVWSGRVLSGVVATFLGLDAGRELADDRLEVVAAVAVQHHQPADPLPRQGAGDVLQHRRLRGRVHVDAERDVELAGLDAERHGGQHRHPGAAPVGDPGGLGRDGVGLDRVRAVGQVEVVGLRRPPGKDDDVGRRFPHFCPGRLGDDPGSRLGGLGNRDLLRGGGARQRNAFNLHAGGRTRDARDGPPRSNPSRHGPIQGTVRPAATSTLHPEGRCPAC